jgi:hypothetical protein
MATPSELGRAGDEIIMDWAPLSLTAGRKDEGEDIAVWKKGKLVISNFSRLLRSVASWLK